MHHLRGLGELPAWGLDLNFKESRCSLAGGKGDRIGEGTEEEHVLGQKIARKSQYSHPYVSTKNCLRNPHGY